ncbi:MAG: hypothetical protein DKINENOH_02543 [bacterium]|nr:hypothetical protein [bacterium]
MHIKNSITTFVLAAIGIAPAISLHAQFTAAGSLIPLGQLPGDNLHPDFTRANTYPDPHDTRELWLAWDAGTTLERHVYVRKYVGPQQQWGTPIAITSGSSINQYPDIENLGDSILVVWESNERGNFDILFSLYDGTAWSESAAITSDTTDDRKPVLFAQYRDQENGGWDRTALVVWECGAKLMWGYFDGQKWGLPQDVPGALDSAKSPQIGMSSGKFPVMVWEGLVQDNWDIYCSWYMPDSNAWATAPIRLTTQPAEDRDPQIGYAGIYPIAFDSAYYGDGQIVWQTNVDGNQEIYSGYFSITPDPAVIEGQNISQHDSTDCAPTAQFISEGDVFYAVVAWQTNRAGFANLVSNYLYLPCENLPSDSIPDQNPVLSQSVHYDPAYYWLTWERFENGRWSIYGLPFIRSYVGTVSEKNVPSPPHMTQLVQNYPNPFNPETRIVFFVPPSSLQQRVVIKIFDLTGRLVRVLFDREIAPGRYEVIWDGRDAHNNELASGMYVYRLEAGDRVIVKRMTLLR